MARRLFKVIVQTVYLDEEDREIATQPVAVARQDWDEFVATAMPAAVQAFCGQGAGDAPGE